MPCLVQMLASVNHCYRVLDSMAPQELCTSTMESIVEGSSIECLYFLFLCLQKNSLFQCTGDMDIQVLTMKGAGLLLPIYEYFAR